MSTGRGRSKTTQPAKSTTRSPVATNTAAAAPTAGVGVAAISRQFSIKPGVDPYADER